MSSRKTHEEIQIKSKNSSTVNNLLQEMLMNKDQVLEDLIDIVADKAPLIQKYKTEVVKDTKKFNKNWEPALDYLNQDGLLRGPSEDYLSCLQMDTAGLIRC